MYKSHSKPIATWGTRADPVLNMAPRICESEYRNLSREWGIYVQAGGGGGVSVWGGGGPLAVGSLCDKDLHPTPP